MWPGSKINLSELVSDSARSMGQRIETSTSNCEMSFRKKGRATVGLVFVVSISATILSG